MSKGGAASPPTDRVARGLMVTKNVRTDAGFWTTTWKPRPTVSQARSSPAWPHRLRSSARTAAEATSAGTSAAASSDAFTGRSPHLRRRAPFPAAHRRPGTPNQPPNGGTVPGGGILRYTEDDGQVMGGTGSASLWSREDNSRLFSRWLLRP